MVIFFDLDATLLDHDAAAQFGATRFFEHFKPSFEGNLEEFLARWERVSEKYFQSSAIGHHYSHLDQRRMRMRGIFEGDLPDEEADRRFAVYLEAYESAWKLFPDSLPCLKALQGRGILGLITNGEGKQQWSKVRKLGLESFLSHVIISREVDCAKPQKAIFELAAKRAQADIRECVYVGDRLETDAIASQEAGMRGIWLDRKNRWNGGEVGTPVIRGLAELPGVLKV